MSETAISPEKKNNKLDKSNANVVPTNGYWKTALDEGGRYTFQNVADLEEYGREIGMARNIDNDSSDFIIVLVLDNKGEVMSFGNEKHYWVIDVVKFDGSSDNTVFIRHLTEFISIIVEEGQPMPSDDEVLNNLLDKGAFKAGSFQGYSVFCKDAAIDDSRPNTQTESTTGAKTNNTVKTTTTQDPKTGGPVTTSETTPAETSSTPPSTTTSSSTTAEANTSPTTVTTNQPNSTPTNTSTPATGATQASPNQSVQTATASSSNVYIYEQLQPGFDRYDFNTGKKVYTPDNGSPSRNAAGQTSAPSTETKVTPPTSVTSDQDVSIFNKQIGGGEYKLDGKLIDPNLTGPF